MKKILMTFMFIFSVLVANAQIATQNAKAFDNVYVTLNGGVATPLNFKNVFPVNPTFGLAIGKQISPVFTVEAEGTTWFGSHIEVPFDDFNGAEFRVTRFGRNELGNFNAFRGVYVGMNGIVNVTNLFLGYNGKPRTFELAAVAGTGWEHVFTPNQNDKSKNGLGVKTGLDFNFNLGKNKDHTVSFKPAVLWNVVTFGEMPLQFNVNHAQLYVGLGYTYHFKTSNGTHYFKTYDVGEMNDEILRLKEELAKKPKEIIKHTETVNNIINYVQSDYVIQFAQNSSQLSDEAKSVLDNINGRVTVVAYASPEGTDEYNKALSERRAATIADYLINKGVKVISYIGYGCVSETSNRIAIVKIIAD